MAVQYYISVNDFDTLSKRAAHSGTSSTPTDIIELRIGDGTYVPSRRQVFNALEIIERHLQMGGDLLTGANLPLPTGPG